MIRPQKYAFVFLIFLFFRVEVNAQCLTLPNAVDQILNASDKIIEGRVVQQQAFVDTDGNIYTRNNIDVYRVFKGNVGFSIDVITEGGVFGDMMQVVTPSTQLNMQDYGVFVLQENKERSLGPVAVGSYRINEGSGVVSGIPETDQREDLYDIIASSTGSETIELRRIPQDLLETGSEEGSRDV
ncbi:MAG: hypothetical protein QF371_02345, partial [Flavobacteriales bacterium]|nr:hypothetical protein [Flavobacteriales bacterium]